MVAFNIAGIRWNTVAACLFYLCLAATRFDVGSCSSFNRSSFPKDFIFGAGSSAYQYEGAVKEGGKGPSIWDTFTHLEPSPIADGTNGDIAIDFYHRYKDDLKILKDMNADAFRMSIAWTRILPNGSLSGGISQDGINYYNNLINEVLAQGLQPFVTIFHWDAPQALEDKYGGFRSDQIINDYLDFADICFKEFGDRVKAWSTFNEPWSFCVYGYANGAFAPGRCTDCKAGGDSGREPYTVGHNLLLAHGAAVKLYRDKYKVKQKGNIGIALVSNWFVPYNESSRADIDARDRSLDFMLGWFMDPIVYGDYPVVMKGYASNRLPSFTPEQSALLNGSYDFIGINYYTTWYTIATPAPNSLEPNYLTDTRANTTGYRNGVPIGPPAYTSIFYTYPAGLRELLLYMTRKYKSPAIYVTENGTDEANNKSIPLKEALKDSKRVSFTYKHLLYAHLAIKDGVNLKGYFMWTFIDDWEWGDGFKDRFGLVYTDFEDNLKRIPKKSWYWFREFLAK